MKVSIMMPSVYPEACARALRNIRETTVGDYEVVVVSPFDPGTEVEHVLWVPDTCERRGSAWGSYRAAQAATGDIIVAFADDFLFVKDWDRLVISDFLERERLVPTDKPFVLGMRYSFCDFVGTQFGIYYANFPVMRRESARQHGWVSPEYRVGFGDGDLGMRVWDRGGRCEFSRDKVLIVTEDDQRKGGLLFSENDIRLFVSRWAPRFGKGWNTDNIRGFNIDVCPEDHPEIVDASGRTIFCNDPSFMRKIMTSPRSSKTISETE